MAYAGWFCPPFYEEYFALPLGKKRTLIYEQDCCKNVIFHSKIIIVNLLNTTFKSWTRCAVELSEPIFYLMWLNNQPNYVSKQQCPFHIREVLFVVDNNNNILYIYFSFWVCYLKIRKVNHIFYQNLLQSWDAVMLPVKMGSLDVHFVILSVWYSWNIFHSMMKNMLNEQRSFYLFILLIQMAFCNSQQRYFAIVAAIKKSEICLHHKKRILPWPIPESFMLFIYLFLIWYKLATLPLSFILVLFKLHKKVKTLHVTFCFIYT